MQHFKSKKLIIALVGVLVILAEGFGIQITPEAIDQVVNIIMVYLGGQSIVDVAKVVKK